MALELSESDVPAVARHELNALGRDFVVGDIHGMFDALYELLQQVEFDPNTDRVFSVGDLIDRGPMSDKALEWLDKPWFHACRGNHEHFAIYSTDPTEFQFWVNNNGGEWWLDLGPDSQAEFRERLLRLPLAMEVETATGTVGIVHADLPKGTSWRDFCDDLRARLPATIQHALFSRDRVYGVLDSPDYSDEGITCIYCGHTPVREVVEIGAIRYIDTAAVYVREGYVGARLTMMELHPAKHRQHSVHTRDWG